MASSLTPDLIVLQGLRHYPHALHAPQPTCPINFSIDLLSPKMSAPAAKTFQREPKGAPIGHYFRSFGVTGGNVKTMVPSTRNHHFEG